MFLDGFRGSGFEFALLGKDFQQQFHMTSIAQRWHARFQPLLQTRCLPLEQEFFHQWLPLSLRRPELRSVTRKLNHKSASRLSGNEGWTQRIEFLGGLRPASARWRHSKA